MSGYKKAVALATLLACSGLIASDAMAQKRGPAWSELGCRKVSFIGKDRDVIKVGRKEGRFRAIRLKARGNDVEMLDLKVVYANGAARRYPRAQAHPRRQPDRAARSQGPGPRHRQRRDGLQVAPELQRPGDRLRRRPAVVRSSASGHL